MGTPVIIASGSCLEEAAGIEAPVVSPDDVDAYIAAAWHIIDDSSYRHDIVEAGRKHIARFSQQNFACGLRDSYRKALDSK